MSWATRPFTTLLPESASRARSWNTAVTLQFPLTYCILVLEVWLQVSPAQTAIHQPCSICTCSQFNDPQGIAWTRLWISLSESNYSSGLEASSRPFFFVCLCAGIDLWGRIPRWLPSNVFVCSSMLEPSSRCVDENWGGSLKSKVSFLPGLWLLFCSLLPKNNSIFIKTSFCLKCFCLTQWGWVFSVTSFFPVGGIMCLRASSQISFFILCLETRPPVSAQCNIWLIQCQVTLMELLELFSVVYAIWDHLFTSAVANIVNAAFSGGFAVVTNYRAPYWNRKANWLIDCDIYLTSVLFPQLLSGVRSRKCSRVFRSRYRWWIVFMIKDKSCSNNQIDSNI